ncbi:MAG: hypothetical protein NTX29_07050, partial [Actinobacteria bacterium]|nr:hypothetical protein [Actinomycetota bacterium]
MIARLSEGDELEEADGRTARESADDVHRRQLRICQRSGDDFVLLGIPAFAQGVGPALSLREICFVGVLCRRT